MHSNILIDAYISFNTIFTHVALEEHKLYPIHCGTYCAPFVYMQC